MNRIERAATEQQIEPITPLSLMLPIATFAKVVGWVAWRVERARGSNQFGFCDVHDTNYGFTPGMSPKLPGVPFASMSITDLLGLY